MRFVSSASRYELVPPTSPEHGRQTARQRERVRCGLQLSMLLLPMTDRANFCVMKFSSLVAFEQLKSPKLVGPLGVDGGLEAGGGSIQGLVPRRPSQRPGLCGFAVPDKWVAQVGHTVFGIAHP